MSDPTKQQTLSEAYPLCTKAGLTLRYNMYSGDHIPAEEVERLIKAFAPAETPEVDD